MTEDLSNTPGRGAEELASRAALRAARLRQDQAMGLEADAAVAELLREAVRRQRNYSQGAEGERLVAEVLALVERYGWVALHDVHWPGRPQANIDHIAVGPGGVVVIDAKNWTGDVAVTNGVLRQNGYSRSRETAAAADATSAVTSRLAPQHRTATHAVLCLVGQDAEPMSVDSSTVLGRASLAEYLVSLPVRFSAYDVADVARMLSDDLAGARSPAVLTSRDLDVTVERKGLRELRGAASSLGAGAQSPRPSGGGGRAPRPSRAPRQQRRTPRWQAIASPPRRGAGRRARKVLVKVVLIVAYAPTAMTGIFQGISAAVTTSLTPPGTPAPPPVQPPLIEPVPAVPESGS